MPVKLSPRQIECLSRIARGETSAEIAVALGLSKRTIDHYVNSACGRLGVRNRAQAVAIAISEGLIVGPDQPFELRRFRAGARVFVP